MLAVCWQYAGVWQHQDSFLGHPNIPHHDTHRAPDMAPSALVAPKEARACCEVEIRADAHQGGDAEVGS